MDITVTSSLKDQYIFIASAGRLEKKEDLFRHAELMYREINRYDKKVILIDNRNTIFPLNKLDYYDQIKYFSTNLPEEIRFYKLAIVMDPKYEEIGQFWETVAVNRGFQYHSFTSIEEAHNWLVH